MAVHSARSSHAGRQVQTGNEPVLIEISDEAYKQNTVYRPWAEILRGISNAVSDTSGRESKARPIVG